MAMAGGAGASRGFALQGDPYSARLPRGGEFGWLADSSAWAQLLAYHYRQPNAQPAVLHGFQLARLCRTISC